MQKYHRSFYIVGYMKEITFDRFVRGLMVTLGIIVVIYVLNYLSSILLPFVTAWLITYLIYPIVIFFQHKLRLRFRALSVVVTLILLAAAITGLCLLAIPPIIDELIHLKNIATAYLENGSQNSTIPAEIETFARDNIKKMKIERVYDAQDVFNLIREVLPRIWSVFYQTANIIFSIISSCVTLLYIFFLLIDYEKFASGWVSLIPKRKRQFAISLVNDVESEMNSYFRGQSLIAFCVGILFSIGFLIIDFPMAVGLGLFIGVLNLVPYLQLVGFIPTILLALLKAADTGENFWLIFGSAMLVFIVVQLIQDLILTPRIMGKIMGLSPTMILLSLSVWGIHIRIYRTNYSPSPDYTHSFLL